MNPFTEWDDNRLRNGIRTNIRALTGSTSDLVGYYIDGEATQVVQTAASMELQLGGLRQMVEAAELRGIELHW